MPPTCKVRTQSPDICAEYHHLNVLAIPPQPRAFDTIIAEFRSAYADSTRLFAVRDPNIGEVFHMGTAEQIALYAIAIGKHGKAIPQP